MKKITSLIASIICIGTLLGGCDSTHPRVTGTVTNKIIGEGWLDPNIVEIETADGSKVNLKAYNNAFDFCAEGMKATLADCIYQTPCLKRLKFSESEADKKFSDYLSMVRDWRNDNAHKAPIATEQECDTAINVLTSMYLYVVTLRIKSCEITQSSVTLYKTDKNDSDEQ